MSAAEPRSGAALMLARLERLQKLFEQADVDLRAAEAIFDDALMSAEVGVAVDLNIGAAIDAVDQATANLDRAERRVRRLGFLAGQLIARITRQIGAAAPLPARVS